MQGMPGMPAPPEEIIMSETLVTDPLDTGWMVRGSCLNEDPEIFWIDSERDNPDVRAMKAEAAKKICASCPVRVSCLIWGLLAAPDDHWSVLGATTHRERSAIRRKIGLS